MIDLAPPPLVLPAPAIIRPVAGGLWGSLDAEMARMGLDRRLRRAIVTELRRVIGTRECRPAVDDLTAWARTNGAPVSAASLAQKLLRATSAGAAVGVEYVGKDGDSANASSYNFGTKALGSGVDGWIVVNAIQFNNSSVPGFSSLTVGGSSATLVGDGGGVNFARLTASGTAATGSALYIIAVSAATTSANVTVTFGSTTGGCAIAIWRLTNLQFPNGALTAYAVDAQHTSNADVSAAVNVDTGGAVIGGLSYYKSGSTIGYSHSTAHAANLAAETARSVSATQDAHPPVWAGATIDDYQSVQGSTATSNRYLTLATASFR